MEPETAEKLWFGVGGLICGAVIAMIIGFGWLGWTTFSTSQEMTKEGVLAARAAICVAQFMKEPNHEEKLKELKEQNYTHLRIELIEKGGWDKMPGEKKAAHGVAEACAEGLRVLISK
jgi:hypothetical protein